MKFLKTVTILISILWISKLDAQVFIPDGDGFQKKEVKVESKSINNICKYLGYNTDQIHTYMNFDKIGGNITAVIFKVFSETIICVITDENIASLSATDVTSYLSGFKYSEEYDSYEIESILNDAIANKTFSSKFCAELFSNSLISENSTVVVPQLGYELGFSNGILTKFNSSDGLNKWSKEWKVNSPSLFNNYRNYAAQFWKSDEPMILNEINIQADAYARTPEAAGNEYVKFHTTNSGTVNFKMLMVAHYNEPISLSEFKEINFGRFDLVDEFTEGNYKRTTYKVNQTYFTFSENGELENTYTSK